MYKKRGKWNRADITESPKSLWIHSTCLLSLWDPPLLCCARRGGDLARPGRHPTWPLPPTLLLLLPFVAFWSSTMDRPSAHRSAHNSPTENSSSILFLSIFHPSDQIAIGPSDLSGDDLEANPEVNMIRNPLFFFVGCWAGVCVCVCGLSFALHWSGSCQIAQSRTIGHYSRYILAALAAAAVASTVLCVYINTFRPPE